MEKQTTEKNSEIKENRKKQSEDAQRRWSAAWRNKDKAFLKKEPRHF